MTTHTHIRAAQGELKNNSTEDINFKMDSILIEVNPGRLLNKTELDVIELLNTPKNGYSLESDGNTIFFYLKSINLENFKSRVEGLTTEKECDSEIFQKIIDKIDNIKSYGIRSGKRIYVDYNKERKVKNRQKKVKKRGYYYYAHDSNFSKKENALPSEYENKIICGDSEDILKKLPDNCIDIVFTSPPYNFGLEYDVGDDERNWELYFEKLFVIFKECVRVTKYGGRIIVNVQPLFSDYIPIHHIISTFFMNQKMIWKGEILWEKHNYNCKYTAWGSWKSPSSPYLKYTWEFLEIFCKGELTKKGNKDDIDIQDDEFKKWVYAKWAISPERNMKKYEHPAMFPEELVERVLKLFSYQNDVVLDPFNGIGTTTTVAKKFGRRYLGIDLSKKYCENAKKRMKEVL